MKTQQALGFVFIAKGTGWSEVAHPQGGPSPTSSTTSRLHPERGLARVLLGPSAQPARGLGGWK